MITGFFGTSTSSLIYGVFGWVEVNHHAGIAGSLVYMIVGYVTPGMRARPSTARARPLPPDDARHLTV